MTGPLQAACRRLHFVRFVPVSGTECRAGSEIAPGTRSCHLEDKLKGRVGADITASFSERGSAHCSHNPRVNELSADYAHGRTCCSVAPPSGSVLYQTPLFQPDARSFIFSLKDTLLPSQLCSSQHFQFSVLQKPPGGDAALVVVCAKKYIA